MSNNRTLKSNEKAIAGERRDIYNTPKNGKSELQVIAVANLTEEDGSFQLYYSERAAIHNDSQIWLRSFDVPANDTRIIEFDKDEINLFDMDAIRILSTVDAQCKVFANETQDVE